MRARFASFIGVRGGEPPAKPDRLITMAVEYPGAKIARDVDEVSMDIIFHNRGKSDENVNLWIAQKPPWFTFESMWKMIQGLISTKNLSGPIAIAQVAASTAESGFTTWLSFLALLSISLGAINLLPIPVLDGGHIVFHSLEGLLGRPVPEQIQMMSYQVGLLAVFTLMVFAIYNDVARL